MAERFWLAASWREVMGIVRSLHTSVPEGDVERVRARFPQGVVTSESLEEASVRAYPDVEVLSCMIHDRIDPSWLGRWPSLRAVVTRSTGYDHLPLDALVARGVAAYHLGDYAAEAVAEHALALSLALLRRVPGAMARTGVHGGLRVDREQALGSGRVATAAPGEAREAVSGPSWRRDDLVGRGLSDVRIGVLGTGAIGARFVRMLTALGQSVRLYDLVRDPDLAALPSVSYVDSLAELLAEVDLLSVHVPLVEHGPSATYHMLGEASLAGMPRGAMVVNTARGGVVDLDAVLAALDEGRLGGYACDVLEGEPEPPALAALAGRRDVIVTPHLGAYSVGAIAARYARDAAIVGHVLSGNPDEVDAMAVYRVDGR